MTETDRARIRPLRVTCGQETLSEADRRRISAAFGAPLFDNYGAHEFVGLAWECPARHGYHVSDRTFILEVLRDGRPAGPATRSERPPAPRPQRGYRPISFRNMPCQPWMPAWGKNMNGQRPATTFMPWDSHRSTARSSTAPRPTAR